MSLARESKRVGTLLAVACVGITGCIQRVQNSAPQQNVLPVVADDAMQKRDWAQSTALYPNGGTAAGPTNFAYQPTWYSEHPYSYTLNDSAVFLLNSVLLPYELIVNPPWELKTYQGNTYPPTYTAMPLLPAATEPPMVQSPAVMPAEPSSAGMNAKPVPAPSATAALKPVQPPPHSSTTQYQPLPVSPGAQPTGSPLVTPGRGQPTAPPVTLPPASPNHPATQPTSSPGASTYSPAQAPSAPPSATPAPTPAASPVISAVPSPQPSKSAESPSALDLSQAPTLNSSSSASSSSSSSSASSASPTETKIVNGRLTLVPSTQPTTNSADLNK